jgi:tetratricopeptide (TPR) repeat protein
VRVAAGIIIPAALDRHRPAALPWIALALALAACGHSRDPARPAAQENFGVQMARMNLWREAMFRFQRAVEINPGDAMAHNNLAVAYEANGDFEKARREYLEALKLDRNNSYIQKNYSRYVEFLSRNKKRQQANARATATTSTSPLPPPATGVVVAPQPPDRPIGATPAGSPQPPPLKPSDQPPQPAPPTPPKPPAEARR